jgi:hypothetical protein
MLAFDEMSLLWISCKKGSAFSGLPVTLLAAWVASRMTHFRFGVDGGVKPPQPRISSQARSSSEAESTVIASPSL